MVFVCNLRSIHSLASVVILFAIKTCQPCHYIKPIDRVYTRECHENKTTRFWATMVIYWYDKCKLCANEVNKMFILNFEQKMLGVSYS